MKNIEYIKYTLNHKKVFIDVEKELLGKNTISGYLHDIDKVILYLFLDVEFVNKIHRQYSKHHKKRAHKRKHYIQMVIDWECARRTKEDKQLNTYDTLYTFYPDLEDVILPILKEFNICKSEKINK